MPVCRRDAKGAANRLENKCNETTGRWVKRPRDEVIADLIRCRTKAQERKERMKTARREIKTLHKMQKMYYKLCHENAVLKVHSQILQRHVNVLEDKMPKARKPRVKKAPMKEYTKAEMDAMHEAAAERNIARMDDVIDRYTKVWELENPGEEVPVDFEAEREKQLKQDSKAVPGVVHILVPRKKIKK